MPISACLNFKKGPRVPKPGFGTGIDFVPLLQGGRVSEKSLGVNTLQAAEPPYSVNNGHKKGEFELLGRRYLTKPPSSWVS